MDYGDLGTLHVVREYLQCDLCKNCLICRVVSKYLFQNKLQLQALASCIRILSPSRHIESASMFNPWACVKTDRVHNMHVPAILSGSSPTNHSVEVFQLVLQQINR